MTQPDADDLNMDDVDSGLAELLGETEPELPYTLPPEAAAAIATLRQLHYTYHGGALWRPPLVESAFTKDPDATT